MAVAVRRSVERPWPRFDGRCATIARLKVADLAEDPALQERLAERLVDGANYSWNKLLAGREKAP